MSSDESSRVGSAPQSEISKCGYCKNTVSKSALQCRTCLKIFHPSCGNRVKDNCCGQDLIAFSLRNETEKDKYLAADVSTASSLSAESTNVDLLLKIINQLEENASLYKFKISILEKTLDEKEEIIREMKIKRNKKSDKQYVENIMNVIPSSSEVRQSATDDHGRDQLGVSVPVLATQHKQSSSLNNLSVNQNKQKSRENLSEQTSNRTTSPATQMSSEWKTVGKRRKKNIKTRYGTGKTDNNQNGFTGQEKKAWFFINRVKSHVTEEQVKNYIKSKNNFKDTTVEVKELSLAGKLGDLKSFLIKVPFKHKDELYDTEFWPENVGIRRFNFRAYEKNRTSSDFL